MTFENVLNKYNFTKNGINYSLKFKKRYILTLICDEKAIEIKLFRYFLNFNSDYERLYFYNLYRAIYKTDDEIYKTLDFILNILLTKYNKTHLRKLKYKKLYEIT
jgi:hypothetical protein